MTFKLLIVIQLWTLLLLFGLDCRPRSPQGYPGGLRQPRRPDPSPHRHRNGLFVGRRRLRQARPGRFRRLHHAEQHRTPKLLRSRTDRVRGPVLVGPHQKRRSKLPYEITNIAGLA